MDITSIRLQRLQQLLALDRYNGRGGQARLGADIGRAAAQISQWLSGARTISEDSARNIEQKLRLPPLWMDGPSSNDWPFAQITPEQWGAMTPDQRARAEAMIALLLGAQLDTLPVRASYGNALDVETTGFVAAEPDPPPYLPSWARGKDA